MLRRACHQQPHIGFPAAFAGVSWCVSDVQRRAAWVVRPVSLCFPAFCFPYQSAVSGWDKARACCCVTVSRDAAAATPRPRTPHVGGLPPAAGSSWGKCGHWMVPVPALQSTVLQQSVVCMEDSKVLLDTHVGAPHGCWSCLLRAVLQWLWFESRHQSVPCFSCLALPPSPPLLRRVMAMPTPCHADVDHHLQRHHDRCAWMHLCMTAPRIARCLQGVGPPPAAV